MLRPGFLLGRLQRQQQSVLAQVRAFPGEALTRRPGPDEWSPLEVLSHLVKIEEGLAVSVPAKLRKPVQATTVKDVVRGLGLCAFSMTPAKVKMPAAAAPVIAPEPDGDLETLAARWETARMTFVGLDYGPMDRKAVVFRNPVSGWLTPAGTLRFLLAHTFHHRHQLRRIARGAVRSG